MESKLTKKHQEKQENFKENQLFQKQDGMAFDIDLSEFSEENLRQQYRDLRMELKKKKKNRILTGKEFKNIIKKRNL